MSKQNLAAAAAITGIIALGASMVSAPAMAGSKEKCYGVAAAGQNDCATKNSSCAGTSKTDNQGDAFLAIPTGLCEKLAGGSLTPKV
ncbi:MAG: putative signal peptide protein [Osedax symbiont Rs1]|nr:MAG: putative signal peptide protein [Osedax symbiont Rs1]